MLQYILSSINTTENNVDMVNTRVSNKGLNLKFFLEFQNV